MCFVVARVGFAFTRAIDRFELQVAVSSSRWSFGVPGGRFTIVVLKYCNCGPVGTAEFCGA